VRADAPLVAFQVRGDAIAAPLTAQAGDAARGRQIATGRDSNCILCHSVPQEDRVMGNLAPPLAGVGARLAAAQLRLRIVDSQRLNPDTIMPSYYRVEGLVRVAEPYRGKPVLTAQQVEDVIAYLGTLR
jgi:sulfur-oxidizing protein SoxX